MWGISYWVFPIISGLAWIGTLLGLLLNWVINDHSRYLPSFNKDQTVAYISDTGAFHLKALFIAGSAVTMVFLDLAFLSERWLRHQRRLVPNTNMTERILSILAIIAAIVGSVGLICLSCLDTYRHPKAHDVCLAIFIVGWVVNAILICAEYQRLGIHNRNHRILRISFWIKLAFILIEVPLAIGFGVSSNQGHYNTAAYLEWIIALIFAGYVFSFFIDLLPAVRTKHHRYSDQETQLEHEVDDSNRQSREMKMSPIAPTSHNTHNNMHTDATQPPLASNF